MRGNPATVGNLFAHTNFERLVFTPVTLLLAVFCCRLALSNDDPAPASNASA